MPLVRNVVCVAGLDQFLVDGPRLGQSDQADVRAKLLQHPAERQISESFVSSRSLSRSFCRREMQGVTADLDIDAFLAPLASLADLVRHRFQPFIVQYGA